MIGYFVNREIFVKLSPKTGNYQNNSIQGASFLILKDY